MTTLNIETIEPKRRGRPPKINMDGPQNMTDPQELAAFLNHCAMRLEVASKWNAGVMDSESLHADIDGRRRALIVAVAEDLRNKANGL